MNEPDEIKANIRLMIRTFNNGEWSMSYTVDKISEYFIAWYKKEIEKLIPDTPNCPSLSDYIGKLFERKEKYLKELEETVNADK